MPEEKLSQFHYFLGGFFSFGLVVVPSLPCEPHCPRADPLSLTKIEPPSVKISEGTPKRKIISLARLGRVTTFKVHLYVLRSQIIKIFYW